MTTQAQAANVITRDELLARLVRAGELEVSGEIPRGFSQSKLSAWVYSRASGAPRSTARSGAAT